MSKRASTLRQRLVDQGRGALGLFPHGDFGQDAAVWMYAVGFRDGRTKLGVTSRPRSRFHTYWISSGEAIAWVHLFGQVRREKVSKRPAAEVAAIKMAAVSGARIARTEFFRGLDRPEAIRIGRAAIAAAKA